VVSMVSLFVLVVTAPASSLKVCLDCTVPFATEEYHNYSFPTQSLSLSLSLLPPFDVCVLRFQWDKNLTSNVDREAIQQDGVWYWHTSSTWYRWLYNKIIAVFVFDIEEETGGDDDDVADLKDTVLVATAPAQPN